VAAVSLSAELPPFTKPGQKIDVNVSSIGNSKNLRGGTLLMAPLKGADGIFHPFLTRIVPIKDEQGKVVRWFGSNTDVTRQLETEAALKASESRIWKPILCLVSWYCIPGLPNPTIRYFILFF